jgi:acyl carrier protein
MEEIKTKVERFVKKYVKGTEISDDVDIFGLGVVNSLFAMQLVLFVENEFAISVDNNVLGTNQFNSINSICGYIQSQL